MLVKCDNCGKEFNKKPNQIKRHKTHFCSKGCQKEFKNIKTPVRCEQCGKDFNKIPSNIKLHPRHFCSRVCSHEASRKYVGEVSGNYFSKLKHNAKRRKIGFNITQEDIWEKFLEQDRKCVYTGEELTWQDGSFGEKGTASVDRIDSGIGYVINNIQIIHKDINNMKWDLNQDYFLDLCEKVALFNREFTPILNYRQDSKHNRWKGCGEISGYHWSLTKAGAKRRNISFETSIEECWNLYLKQGGICALSGLPIKFAPGRFKSKERTASLDRINSSLPYSIENLQWVNKDINIMKSYFTQEYFIEICSKITKYSTGTIE